MANPSISIPDEVLEDFDKELARRHYEEGLSQKVKRSNVVSELMRAWADGEIDVDLQQTDS